MVSRVSHYVLTEQIGAGGMGMVYRAEDELDGQPVAVKLPHPQMVSDPEFVHGFRREAEAARHLDSPYVIQVLDSGQEGETYFLVMPLVQGETLAELIQRLGRLPTRDVITVATAIAHALAAAHREGIVHRGISPQNVMITPNAEVKVMGFGIPRDLSDFSATVRRQLGGMPFFYAPEMAFSPSAVDVRADIYGLGATMFEMLTGFAPFAEDEPATVGKARIPNVAQLRPDVPAWLAAIMYHCLSLDPAARFQRPEDVLAALASADSPDPEASPVSKIAPATGKTDPVETGRSVQNMSGNGAGWKRVLIGSAIATFVIMVIYGGLALGSSRQSGDSDLGQTSSPIRRAEEALTPPATSTDSLAVVQPTSSATITIAPSASPDVQADDIPTAIASVQPTLVAGASPAQPPIAPAPTRTLAPASSSAPPASSEPPATSTPVQAAAPPTATLPANCAALATVSDIAPAVGGKQTATGQYSCNGKPVSDVPMAALFSFGDSTAKCTGVSDDSGVARCTLGLEAATPGQFVPVSICFAAQGTAYCRQTGFTPQ